MLYFVLISITLILALIGYLVYTEYRENIIFRGEKFSESILAKKVIDFFMPNRERARIIDNRLFYLFNDFNVRDYVMFKVIIVCCSIVLSVAIVTTNYLNSREQVFTKYRSIPFTITENDFYYLTEGVTFEVLDRMKDQNIIMSNAQYSDNYQRYLTVDSSTLYDVLLEIYKDLDSVGGLKLLINFFLIVVFLSYLPDIVLYQLNKMLIKDMDFEFAKLESYIYANANKRVELILRGLSYESVIFRKYSIMFLKRYREDEKKTFKLFLSSPGISRRFKQLVEYILLLKTTNPDKVRDKISINQASHMSLVRSSIISSTNNKKSIVKFLIFGSFLVGLFAIAIGVIGSISIEGVRM